jgi:hypothetical protein
LEEEGAEKNKNIEGVKEGEEEEEMEECLAMSGLCDFRQGWLNVVTISRFLM